MKYYDMGRKLAECGEWLQNPNATAGLDIKRSIIDSLEDISAALCKMSAGPNASFSDSGQRRETRQMYHALNPDNRPRDQPIPLFSTARENGIGRVLSCERIHNEDHSSFALEPSRLVWNCDPIGQRRSCAYEATHPGVSDITTSRIGGKPRFTPGSIQHKLNAQGVPAKSIEQALDGEYVQLCDFLSPIGAPSNLNNPDLECFC